MNPNSNELQRINASLVEDPECSPVGELEKAETLGSMAALPVWFFSQMEKSNRIFEIEKIILTDFLLILNLEVDCLESVHRIFRGMTVASDRVENVVISNHPILCFQG